MFDHVRLKAPCCLTQRGPGLDQFGEVLGIHPVPQSVNGIEGFPYVSRQAQAFRAFLGHRWTISQGVLYFFFEGKNVQRINATVTATTSITGHRMPIPSPFSPIWIGGRPILPHNLVDLY